MTMLTKIGNSQGIRIPKPIVKQAELEGVEIEFVVLEEGLLLKPVKKEVRKGWAESIRRKVTENSGKKDEALLDAFLDDRDLEVWEW